MKVKSALVARAGAWAIAVLAIALVLLTLRLAALTSAPDARTVQQTVFLTLNGVISALVGAVVIDRRGNHVVGWLFCLSGLCWAIAYLGGAVGGYVLGGGEMAGSEVVMWASGWTSFLAFALAPMLIVYLFPTGRLAGPRWRFFFAVAVAVTVLGVVGSIWAPGELEDLPFDNPYGVSGSLGAVATVVRDLGWPLMLFAMAAGVVSLRRRMRISPFEQRQQIKWFLLAGMLLVAFVTFWGVVETLGHPEIAAALGGIFLPLLPLALGTAILRHRLYDIDVLINRTLVYGSLSAVLATVYLAAIVIFSRLLATVTTDSNIAIAASTLAVAALFRPIRARIQHFIDRRFYRQRYNAVATVGRFSSRLRHQIDLDALEGELLGVVGETLQPAAAGLWLKTTEAPP